LASCRIRRLYSAVKRRRAAFGTTSVSVPAPRGAGTDTEPLVGALVVGICDMVGSSRPTLNYRSELSHLILTQREAELLTLCLSGPQP
jgi:hypothetical protein